MKLVKSLLLGSAAGLAAVSVASAADLPSRKAAPVEYVRVCSEHGKGFFYIPGSDTCVQIGGRVRAEVGYWQTNDRNQDAVNFRAQGRINLDVRNNTPYGTVRAYVRYLMTSRNNNFGSDFARNGTGNNTSFDLDKGYIQFAGLTAGRATSFFDFYANNYNFATIRTSDLTTNLFAYTATFGNGFSASLSLEDGTMRRGSLYSTYTNGLVNDVYGYRSINYAGQTAPDVVGNILVTQDWGQARLAAALHQIRPAFYDRTFGGAYSIGYGDRYFTDDTEYGFAVSGGVKFNLPMIAPGDELWIEATYSEGAVSYLGAPGTLAQGGIVLPVTDAFVDVNGKTKKAKGFSVIADLLHYWTPSVRQNLFASYMKINYGNRGYSVGTLANGADYNFGFVDISELKIGTNVIWSPIKNFDIGVEVLYSRLDPKGRVLDNNNGANYLNKTLSSDDSWQGRLRVQRDF